jgi:hypothetical protein
MISERLSRVTRCSAGHNRYRKVILSATHFLNVDLDIYSKRDLQSLIKRLGRKVIALYIGRERGKFCAHLEVAKNVRTADSAILAFCGLIEGLPKPERALWNAATVRSFSIGIQAGRQPSSCDFTIRPKTVGAVSLLGAQIVLTIYAPKTVGESQSALR